MHSEVVRLNRPPKATLANPLAQVEWIFHQLEREYREPTAAAFRNALKKYILYLAETRAYYPELEHNPRFELARYWKADALIRFNRWLLDQGLSSKTKYTIYKTVRAAMDYAYALRMIDNIVYHAPMFKGVSETKQRAAYGKQEQEVINASITRWVGLAEQVAQDYVITGEGIPHRRKLVFPTVEIDGVVRGIRAAAKQYGVAVGTITLRLKSGHTPRQAVGIDPLGHGGVKKALIIEGVKYESISKAAAVYKVHAGHVSSSLQRGASPEQAVGISPRIVKQSDERALLWVFENEYDGDPLAMVEAFRRKPRPSVATEKRLRGLFLKWGVWPYIDDRLIMPLFVKLAMLTGLNAEALKDLQIDSFQLEHRLTGQPVIYYRKPRSGRRNRSEDRELHLALLEHDELYPTEMQVPKIQALITLVLQLTSRIREQAPAEISTRLFIFEDVEASRKIGCRKVIAVENQGKSSKWYRRFANEECFESVFGRGFNFNVSRCRPTLATNMVLMGAGLFQIQMALGHESVSTTVTYLDERRLQPVFNKTVSEALTSISRRTLGTEAVCSDNNKVVYLNPDVLDTGKGMLVETLSGCGCRNPYSPSAEVRKATHFTEGGICRYWNMCLLCDNAVITEKSLPKLMLYRERLGTALEADAASIRSRRPLLDDIAKLIDGILQPDVIFPSSTLQEARRLAVGLDDLLVDQLIYQGM